MTPVETSSIESGRRLRSILAQEVERGSALGASAHVILNGEVVFDFACGRHSDDRPLQTSDDVPWFSMSKVASTVAIARAWERGLFDLDEPVSSYIPEFRGGGKDDITIRQLWTHTAPLLTVDRGINTAMSQDEALSTICFATADDNRDDRGQVGYLGHAGFLLLSEVVTRRSEISFANFFAQEVAMPLRLRSRLGLPAVASDLVDVPFLRTAPTRVRFNAAAAFASNCVTGPIGDAATVCDLLVHAGTINGHQVLRPETVEALISPQHHGVRDQRLQMPSTMGLGFALDEYDFGRYCSTRSFGHGGARSSAAFGDPDADLSVAVFFNGLCPLDEHVRRINAASSAVYLDWELVDPTRRGRDHCAPYGLVI